LKSVGVSDTGVEVEVEEKQTNVYKNMLENAPIKACNITQINLKGQSHEKVGEMSVWGISLGPN
jgi:hypothetical protein